MLLTIAWKKNSWYQTELCIENCVGSFYRLNIKISSQCNAKTFLIILFFSQTTQIYANSIVVNILTKLIFLWALVSSVILLLPKMVSATVQQYPLGFVFVFVGFCLHLRKQVQIVYIGRKSNGNDQEIRLHRRVGSADHLLL